MKAHKRSFEQYPDFTSLVVDKEEFREICEKIKETPIGEVTKKEWEDSIEKLRKLGTIPLVMNGTAVKWLFDKYQIETSVLGIVQRGFVEKLIETIEMDNLDPQRN